MARHTADPAHLSPTDASAAAVCGIVPPHLLQHLAQDADPQVARMAQRSLQSRQRVGGLRRVRGSSGSGRSTPGATGFVPGSLTGAVAEAEAPAATGTPTPARRIHDAEHTTELPGTLVRAEGAEPTGDESVNEAYDGLGHTFDLLAAVYGRNSLDDEGLPLIATVHYDRDFANAFWDGAQMVFGDGDGEIFSSFTDSLDVIAHELAHGLTQYTAGFTYVAQPGALNESVSDVFGSLVKQRLLGQSVEEADWLIGEDIFVPGVNAKALRSMKAPGTAYDDPRLGTDPQPATMDDYVVLPHDDENDNGGVHINSGIPNHAFYLAATALGGNAWERAGQVWYDTITGRGIPQDADFATFADLTLTRAAERYGEDSAEHTAIAEAWRSVGVLDAAGETSGIDTSGTETSGAESSGSGHPPA